MNEARDIVIVGAGLAGMSCALRATELGLKPLVLEQGSAEKYLCNSRYTGGTFHVCLRDIMSDEEELLKAIHEGSQGFVADELARVMAREGRRVVRWLQSLGTRFIRASPAAYHNWVLAPPGRSRPGLDWEGRSGDVLLRQLEDKLRAAGGELRRSARARSLLFDGARCQGVVAEVEGREVQLHARAVLIADGGFQANPELIRRFITPHPERLMQRNAGTARGDGLRMAEEAGAQLVGTDRFYGHLLSREAFTHDQLWPYPYLDQLANAAMLVTSAGTRFVDEGKSGVYLANTVAKLDDPLSAFVIYDRAIWEGAGKQGLIPANPHLEREGGTMHRADSLEALAAKAGIAAAALVETVRSYNAALGAGTLASLSPPRSTGKQQPVPIAAPPFIASPMCAGITHTMGGIAVDVHARALRADGSAIEGLYAAGTAAGGLEGGPAVGYVGGLVRAGLFGMRSAEHMAGAAR